MPICRYLHFHDSAVPPLSPTLRNKNNTLFTIQTVSANKPEKTLMVELTSTFLNKVSDCFCFIICHFKDIAEAIENNLNDLGILHRQEVAEWWDHLLLNQVCHLHARQALKIFSNLS